jgi:methyl-accepting chemotaxis protein
MGKRKARGLGIRGKLIGFFVVSAVIPLIILSSVLYFRLREEFKVNLEVSMSQITEEINHTLSYYNQGLEDGVSYMANEAWALELATEGTGTEDVFALFERYMKHHPYITNMYIGDSQGNMYLYPEQELPADYDPRIRAWYKGAESTKATIVTDPYADASSGSLTMSVASPIITNGEVVGVMSFDIFMTELSAEITEIQIGSSGYPVLVGRNEEGQLITLTHKNPDLIGDVIPVPEIIEAIDSGSQDAIRYTYEGTSKIAVYKGIEGQDTYILATLDVSEIDDNVSAVVIIALIVMLISVVVIILFAYMVSGFLTGDLIKVGHSLSKIKDGDLTIITQIKSKDEIGELADNLNGTVGGIRTIVGELKSISDDVATSSRTLATTAEKTSQSAEEVTRTADEIARGASEQATEAEKSTIMTSNLSDQMDELSVNTGSMLENVREVMDANTAGIESMGLLHEKSQENNEATERIEKAINALDEKAKEIGNILVTITSIADQTNLLALNASIEAARAGEQGKGFAVVADEIRKLAEDSRSATEDIRVIVQNIQEESNSTVGIMEEVKTRSVEQLDAVNESNKAFELITDKVGTISSKIESINDFVTEMNDKKDEIVLAISNISSISEETAAASQEVTASMEQQNASVDEVAQFATQLDELANRLMARFEQFKV